MNTWRSRIAACALLIACMWIHAETTADLPNTPVGMLLFHGSAFTADLFLVWSIPYLLSGRVCDWSQALCLVSIVANFFGWLAYLAYAPPVFYNTFMWSVSYVQYGIILFVDRHDNSLGFDMVRGRYRRRSQIYSREAHP